MPLKAPTRPEGLLLARSALAYAALVAGVLQMIPGAETIGAVVVILAICLGWQDLRRVSRMLLGLVAIAGVSAALTEPGALAAAATNMTRLTALIIAVMLLSSMLGRSKDLDTISRGLFSGRPLSRYFNITFGTVFMAVPLNFGSVGVVAAMIQGEKTRGGDSAMTRNAARGMLRGFGASPICSPLSISVVITLTFLPGLHGWQLIGVSLPLAVSYLLFGTFFREKEQPARKGSGKKEAPEYPSAGTQSRYYRALPWLRFAGIIAAICAATFGLSGLMDMSYGRAVTLSCLAAVGVSLIYRLTRRESAELPSMALVSNELVIVGGSAFLGALVSAFATTLLGVGFDLPAWAFPVTAFIVPWAFFCAGMVGLNPIVIGTLIGGVLGPIWPGAAVLGLGIAMVSGWGLTTAGTPYSANSLLLNRLTGYDVHEAAMRWNMRLSLISLAIAGGLAAGLTFGMG